MGAKEEDGKLDIGWLHSTVWDFIDLVEKTNSLNVRNNKKSSPSVHIHKETCLINHCLCASVVYI